MEGAMVGGRREGVSGRSGAGANCGEPRAGRNYLLAAAVALPTAIVVTPRQRGRKRKAWMEG